MCIRDRPILPQADLGGERTNYVADGNTNVATPAHASASTADYEVEEMEDIEQEDLSLIHISMGLRDRCLQAGSILMGPGIILIRSQMEQEGNF